jgi:hypothetical protein
MAPEPQIYAGEVFMSPATHKTSIGELKAKARSRGAIVPALLFGTLEVAEGNVVEPGEGLQLDEIDPALAGLALGEEGLWLLERLGSLHLGQTRLQPRLLEPEPELGIGVLVVGGFQGEPTVRP